jgi:hypothetical protein
MQILPRRKFLVRLGGVLFCLVVMAQCVGCFEFEPKWRWVLRREFKSEFGFFPPLAIREIQCKKVQVGDTYQKWMMFTADESTIQRIVAGTFTRAKPEQLSWASGAGYWTKALEEPNANEPEWWRLPHNKEVRAYFIEGNPADANGYTFLWIDDVNKIVYVKFAAWH